MAKEPQKDGDQVIKIGDFQDLLVQFLARLDEIQEELLYYPRVGVGVSKMFKFLR